MAKAPAVKKRAASTNGSSNGKHADRVGFKITVGARSVVLDLAKLGPDDALRVRQETGLALRQIIGGEESFDIDTICILWWLARWKEGERRLTLKDAMREFPSFAEAADGAVELSELVDDDQDPDLPEA